MVLRRERQMAVRSKRSPGVLRPLAGTCCGIEIRETWGGLETRGGPQLGISELDEPGGYWPWPDPTPTVLVLEP